MTVNTIETKKFSISIGNESAIETVIESGTEGGQFGLVWSYNKYPNCTTVR